MEKEINSSTDMLGNESATQANVGGDNPLAPCPLCGKPEIKMEIWVSHAKIWCSRCHLVMTKNYIGVYSTLADAIKEMRPIMIKAWNRRATYGQQ